MADNEKTPLGSWTPRENQDVSAILKNPYYNVPPVLADCTQVQAQGKAKKLLEGFFADFPEHYEAGRGLFLFAEKFGSGKSGTAACILRKSLEYDVRGYFISMDDMVRRVLAREHIDDDQIPLRDFLVDRADILVIDDLKLGGNGLTPTIADIIEGVIKGRADRQRMTIITCNLGLEEIKKKFGAAFVEIISSNCIPVKLDDVDWRGPLKAANKDFAKKYT